MKLWGLLLCNALIAFKIVEIDADPKKLTQISHGERLYRFALTEGVPTDEFTVNINATSQKDSKKVLPPLIFMGKIDHVNNQIAAVTLEEIVAARTDYKVKVTATNKATNKKKKFEYVFTVIPKIQFEYLHSGSFKNVTFPLKYGKVESEHASQALRINIDPESKVDNWEIKQDKEYVMLHKLKDGPPPEIRFHLVEEVGEQRSEDITIPRAAKPHPVNRIQMVIFTISLGLVLTMITVLAIFYYRNRHTTVPSDEERGPVPLFTSPGMSRQANVAIDPYTTNPNVLDLRDIHAK